MSEKSVGESFVDTSDRRLNGFVEGLGSMVVGTFTGLAVSAATNSEGTMIEMLEGLVAVEDFERHGSGVR